MIYKTFAPKSQYSILFYSILFYSIAGHLCITYSHKWHVRPKTHEIVDTIPDSCIDLSCNMDIIDIAEAVMDDNYLEKTLHISFT